jgi:hypothetical protein
VHQHRVAIRGCFGNGIGANRTTSAGLILDSHRLSHRLTHPLGGKLPSKAILHMWILDPVIPVFFVKSLKL